MDRVFHSVTLDKDKCKGCINCMKHCPTEAIRVREGKAKIITERCIDCGACIRICHNRAKKAICDDFEMINNFEYKVVLAPPSLYGQFLVDDINYVLTALKNIGFDSVFEVSTAAEKVSHLTRESLNQLRACTDGPIISSACTAILRLIKVRFPDLCNSVLPITEPIHIAAQMAKDEAVRETGLPPEKIGIFFISPCPAKVTSCKSPVGGTKSLIDGVFSVNDVYVRLLAALKKVDVPEQLMRSGIVGINWAQSGGECAGLLTDNYIYADGMENVIKVLEEIEDGKLPDTEFVELGACPGGCVGGVLNVANPFVARSRISALRRYLPLMLNRGISDATNMFWEQNLQFETIFRLDENREEAMRKMRRLKAIESMLPGLDCGACGAPTCRALAEDIVCGNATIEECVFKTVTDKKNAEVKDDK